MNFNGNEKIGDIVAEVPGAMEVFKKHRIDFCCGGNRQLIEVIKEQGLDKDSLLAQLNAGELCSEKNIARQDANIDWRTASFTALVNYVVSKHHRYLDKVMPDISELTMKIMQVHGAGHPELARVNSLFQSLKAELEEHLVKEETLLFPLIEKYDGNASLELLQKITKIIDEIEAEHEQAGDIIKELRAITKDYALPGDACASYKLTFKMLEEMESDLFQHIHIENNILHPRLALEKRKMAH